MQKITPCLWFNDQAEEAAHFYTSLFKNATIGEITHYGEGSPRPKGSVLTVRFQLDGQEFLALNGGPQFTFRSIYTDIPHRGPDPGAFLSVKPYISLAQELQQVLV